MTSKKNINLFLILLLLLSGVSTASEKEKAENFSLKDYNGIEHSLTDFKNSKAIVVMFIATQCPISNDYNERMVEYHKKYSLKNISFVGINSNKQESVDEIKKHAEENKFEFVILKDHENKIADKFKASVTPEIYVLNSDFEILYHGRIDDSRKESEITSRNLENALEEILSDKEVSVTKAKAFGCTIKRVD